MTFLLITCPKMRGPTGATPQKAKRTKRKLSTVRLRRSLDTLLKRTFRSYLLFNQEKMWASRFWQMRKEAQEAAVIRIP